jgi:urea transport system permease protein
MHKALLAWLKCAAYALVVCTSGATHALTQADALALVDGDSGDRIAVLNRLASGDDTVAHGVIRAMAQDRLRKDNGRVFIMNDTALRDALNDQVVAVTAEMEEVMVNNRIRGALEIALAGLDIVGADPERQLQAARSLQRAAFDSPEDAPIALLQKALGQPGLAPDTQHILALSVAAVALASEDPAVRLAAAHKLGEAKRPVVRPLLMQRQAVETDAGVQVALKSSLAAVDRALAISRTLAELFTGISLGSILLLAALGLAITYGLMGVINMAHGELIMVGAYATWWIQTIFKQQLPQYFDAYLLAAVPISFLVAALVGVVMERTVIRYLYGRPLETLLATWGISLVLMQTVRTLFGAQNVGVENPSWMSGNVLLMGNLSLPWNRIVIVGFALAVLAGVAWVISTTRMGLFVRGVTQNRPIAACMGVNTARIDTYAFALGSGVAGLAGCALSQIGNVGPDLGQNYIVDSFMVVVLGGVGQLAGTVYAALSLGILNKFIEGWAGAVLAKIAVLVFIIVFIQKRPQGMFAMKGRSAES